MKKKPAFIIRILMLCAWLVFSYSNSANALSLVRDAEIEKFIRELSIPIFESADLNPKRVNIYLIPDENVNAFVAGGQNLFIYAGLITAATHANQISGVIAHETGHMMGGHLVRLNKEIKAAQIKAMIGMALGAAAMAAGSGNGGGELGTAILLGSTSMAQSSVLSYTRKEEEMADEFGLNLLADTNQSGKGLLEFMEIIEQEQMLSPKSSPYWQSHPLTEDRKTHIEEKIKIDSILAQKKSNKDEEEFQRVKAKFAGYLWTEYEIATTYKGNSEADRYARTLSYLKHNHYDRAEKEINVLLKQSPNDPYYREIKGQILFERGDVKEAQKEFELASKYSDEHPLILVQLAEAKLQTPGQEKSAIKDLNKALGIDKSIAYGWKLLSIGYGRSEDEGKAFYALAEYYAAIGDKKEALKQIKRAKDKLKKDSIEYLKLSDLLNSLKKK